jgi:hypothetical protein
MEAHPGAVRAHSGAVEAHPGTMKAHHGAIEAHPGVVSAHSGAVEAHPGAVKAHAGAVELTELWSIPLEPWRLRSCFKTPVKKSGSRNVFQRRNIVTHKKNNYWTYFLNPKILNNIHHAYKEHFDLIYIVI